MPFLLLPSFSVSLPPSLLTCIDEVLAATVNVYIYKYILSQTWVHILPHLLNFGHLIFNPEKKVGIKISTHTDEFEAPSQS